MLDSSAARRDQLCWRRHEPAPADPTRSPSIRYCRTACHGFRRRSGTRLIQISTDGVFSGKRGRYREDDLADCDDLYGRSKCLGEVNDPHAITLRTSIIGHELGGSLGWLNWFLSQTDGVNGYTRAVFSGLPTVEIARVIHDIVIPRPVAEGRLSSVGGQPISKFDMLRLIAEAYGKAIEIRPDDKIAIDRSLDSSRFRESTGYMPAAWPDLVRAMHEFG